MCSTTPTNKSVAYTIAGSDSSGGAGIQADLATFASLGVHGCGLITALTAQSRRGVQRVTPTPAEHLRTEFHTLREDLPPKAIKLGMLATGEIAATVGDLLAHFDGPVVCDPVMGASTGGALLSPRGLAELRQLLPRLTLITPNLREAEILSGIAIVDFATVEAAAQALLALGARNVLITGGHLEASDGYCYDYLATGDSNYWLRGENIATAHNHGTGCTLSSAIAAALALGHELADAVVLGKMVVTQGLRRATAIADGPGAVAHPLFSPDLVDLPAILPCRPDLYRQPVFPHCDSHDLGLYPVVDSLAWIEKLLAEGVKTIQLRIKDQPQDELRNSIQGAVALQQRYGARLFINDHWQLAIACGAYGVHLGQEDLATADLPAIASAGLRLGLSNHAWYEIARSHAVEPSYMALGPIYHTTTKQMRFPAQGLPRLQLWVDLLRPRYPVTAIGGIDGERAPAIAATGVGSIAVVRAITEASNYRQAVADLASSLANPGRWRQRAEHGNPRDTR